LATVPQFAGEGRKLLRIAFSYEWPGTLSYWSAYLVRLIYYRTLNLLYFVYKKAKSYF
jgi:hypothetical protein